MSDNLGQLNLDIYQEIIQWISDINTLINITFVCKNFNTLCLNKQLWYNFFSIQKVGAY